MAFTFGMISYLVKDYDEGIKWFKEKLEFTLLEDTPMGAGKRWVVIAPPNAGRTPPMGARILLAKAKTDEQHQTIGRQAGGRVWLFLYTDDFNKDYARMCAAGVNFIEQPRHEAYGTVVVFEDLYGNKWDLVERDLSI